MSKQVVEKVNEMVRHNFGDSEINQMAREIAVKLKKLDWIKAEQKSVASSYSSDIKKMELEVEELTRGINDGYDMRREPCIQVKDYKGGMVYFFLVSDVEDIDLSRFENYLDLLSYFESQKINEVKTRILRPDERQADLFEGPESGDDIPGGESDPAQSGSDGVSGESVEVTEDKATPKDKNKRGRKKKK